MERKIGEVFEFEGKKLQVVEESRECPGCYFENKEKCFNYWGITGECHSSGRKDNKCVIFKEIKSMTRDEAKSMLPFMQAYAEGKTIQFRAHINDEWRDVKELVLNGFTGEYRIKPELKYRPFKSQEECWEEMHKHPNFGWVTDGYYKSTISVKSDSIVVTISSLEYDFGKAYIHFTFADGTPFGIKEE